MKKTIEKSYADIRKQIEGLQRSPRHYAVAFFDLAGSTEYKARRDPTTSLLKIYRHNAEIEEEVAKHQGKFVKSLGDGLLATFEIREPEDIGFPLNAATRIMRTFAKQSPNLSADERIASRVGITVGPVIDFASINPRGTAVPDPQGSAVDLAARLCALAAPNQVLCEETVRATANSAAQRFTFGDINQRMVKGFDAAVGVTALKWDEEAPLEIAYSPPVYFPSGFLTAEFVLDEVRKSKKTVVVTGFSHRHFCDNIELLNLVSDKIKQETSYKLMLVFLHPKSDFKLYASYVTRRRVADLAPETITNLGKACHLFETVSDNVILRCAHYPMIVPLVQRDELVHFTLPLKSGRVGGHREGVVGGGWFSIHGETDLGRRVLANLSSDDHVDIPVRQVADGKTSVQSALNI